MNFSFQTLSDMLPPGSVEYVGNNQLKINLNQLTGKSLALESSCIEPMVQLMGKLVDLTNAINSDRRSQNPIKPPVTFVSKEFIGTPDAPEFLFNMTAAVDTSQFFDNLIDPTDA